MVLNRRGPSPEHKDVSAAPARTRFGQVRSDLSSGQNLEIYVTVLLALTLGLMGIFDVVDGRFIAAATLGTLGLLALSSLASRHQSMYLYTSVQSLTSVLNAVVSGDVPIDRFLAEKAPRLDDHIRAASDVRLLGVTLSRTVRDLVGTLDARLRAGASVRVIVIDPEGTAPVEAVARTVGVTSPEFYRPRITSTIEILSALASLPGTSGGVEVRLLPYVPAFGMYVIDPEAAHGEIYVELYQHRSLEPNPCFALRAERDGRWFKFFVNQFDVLWQSARPLPPPPPTQKPTPS